MFELSGVNYEEVLEQGDSILVLVIASSSCRGFELSGLYYMLPTSLLILLTCLLAYLLTCLLVYLFTCLFAYILLSHFIICYAVSGGYHDLPSAENNSMRAGGGY